MQENQTLRSIVDENGESIIEINGFHVAVSTEEKNLFTTDPAKINKRVITVKDIIEITAKLGCVEWDEEAISELNTEYANYVNGEYGEIHHLQIEIVTSSDQQESEENNNNASEENAAHSIFISIGYQSADVSENSFYLYIEYISGKLSVGLIPESEYFFKKLICVGNAECSADLFMKLGIIAIMLVILVAICILVFKHGVLPVLNEHGILL